MRQPDWTAERAHVERVADEYRARGYQVIVSPSASDLPEFLREYHPDILARGAKDSVLIDVKQRRAVADRDRLRAIAERVERQPGWRFVVVSAPSQGDAPDEQFRQLDPDQVRTLLSEARGLRSGGSHQAALMIYWAALEAAMRFAAQRYRIEVPRPDTWSLMRELVSNGVLDREAYSHLNDVFKLRSAIAHGLQPAEPVDLERVLATLHDTTEALLIEPERPEAETHP